MIERGLLPWPAGHAQWAAKTCFESWTVRRGGVGDLEVTQSVALVRLRLLQYGDRKFDWIGPVAGSADAHPSAGGLRGYKRLDAARRTEYLLPAPFFQAVICNGVDHLAVGRHLKAAGFLRLGNDGKSQACVRVPDGKTIRAYVIPDTILDEADPDFGPYESAAGSAAR